MNARNRDKGIGSGENGTQISGLLVTDEHCGLSAFCLKSWTFPSVVVLINNVCRFHQVLPLRDWHILSPIKLVLPITIANEMTLLPTSFTLYLIITKDINRVLPHSYVGQAIGGLSTVLYFDSIERGGSWHGGRSGDRLSLCCLLFKVCEVEFHNVLFSTVSLDLALQII